MLRVSADVLCEPDADSRAGLGAEPQSHSVHPTYEDPDKTRELPRAPGVIVDIGLTAMVFGSPSDPRTPDNVHGRFG
ncbi:MAG: hypothetical protein WBL53_07995 [Pseudonocardiaceae bacterium]